MSYPVQAAPRRPGVVVAAAVALLLMAAGAVAYAVANLAVTPGTVDRFQVAARATGAGGSEIDPLVSLLRASTALAAVLGVVVGLVLAGLALGLLAGRPGARVATWVVSGLGLLCGCCGLAVLIGQRAAPLRLGADERVTADLLALLGDAYPGWWIPLNAALSVAQILGYLVVAALLTLPRASAFFFGRSAPAAPVAPASGPAAPASGPAAPGSGPAAPGSGPAAPASGPGAPAGPMPPAFGPPAAPPFGYGPPAAAPPAPSPPPGHGPPAPPPPGYGPPADGSRSPWAPPLAPPPGPASPPPIPPPASEQSGPTPPAEDRP